MKLQKFQHFKKIATAICVLAVWLLIWQIIASFVKTQLLFPSPIATFKELGGLVVHTDFWVVCFWSLLRVLIGFLFGVIVGTALAFLTNYLFFLDIFFRPALQIVRVTPIASFILLVVLWLSAGITPIFISFLIVLPIVWGNVSAALKNIDKNLVELTRVYNFSLKKRIFTLDFPSILPYFNEGCMTSLGLAWKASIAAEVLCVTKNSMGIKLYHAKIYLETPSLFAWTIAVIIFSVLTENFLRTIHTRVGKFAVKRRKIAVRKLTEKEGNL